MSDLAERATENPESVTDEEVATLVETAVEGTDTIAVDALQSVTGADPGRPADQLQVALEIAAPLGGEHPEPAAPLAPAVFDLLDHDELRIQNTAARTLAALAPAATATTAERRRAVAELFDADQLIQRVVAVELVAALADDDPDAAVPYLGELVALVSSEFESSIEEVDQTALDSDVARRRFEDMLEEEQEDRAVYDSARQEAATAIALVAESNPGAVADHLDALVGVVETETVAGVRYAVVDALVPVAESYPEEAMVALDALVERFEVGGLPENLARVARVLAFLADADEQRVAEAVRPHLDAVLELLEREDPRVRGATAGLLMYVGEQYPEEVARAEDVLLEMLDAEDPSVRGSAAMVLGAVGGSEARERLSAVAAADPAEEVRAAAGQAAERLS